MKPSLPSGFRDFSAAQLRKRDYIFDTIKKAFRTFGYEPIETPTMENLATLTGKYGEEGDQLLFKVLNSGDYLAKAKTLDNYKKLTFEISEKGLRYDLTIPFARYVVMHQNDIAFPFKRSQIQPVWRADRPQRGRYREFYQCDADVVGSTSLVYEAELAKLYDTVFAELNLPVFIKINNRKILTGIAEVAGIGDKMMQMTIIIDKLDKIGVDGVRNELAKAEYTPESIEIIAKCLEIKDLTVLKTVLATSETALKGIAELEEVFTKIASSPTQNEVVFDVTLARGLNYYTGCIFEVAAKNAVMGSIGGGGRYDDLTGMFGLKGVSGVGISFGLERIYDILEEQNGFPENKKSAIQVLFLSMSDTALSFSFETVSLLRTYGIACDLYPEAAKFQKQMKYANALNVPFVAIVGDEELAEGVVTWKDMTTGEQRKMTTVEMVDKLISKDFK
jgi:histidyl-tRNA synthetase